MYPVRLISINEGWEKFIEKNEIEWGELQRALAKMTNDEIKKDRYIPHYRADRKSRFVDLKRVWDAAIFKENWGSINRRGTEHKSSLVHLDYVKNGVAVNMIVDNGNNSKALFQYLFLDTRQAAKLNLCDSIVLLVAADDVLDLNENWKKESINRFNSVYIESVCRTQLNDLLPIYSGLPFVVVFYSQNEQPLQIENLVSGDDNVIERSIEFEPEYYQAGVGVLSYFGDVLRQKYPNVNAKVRIEQEGNTVRMRIEMPTGKPEVIERELEKYALVIAGQLPPSEFSENKIHVMQLENKLAMAELEIRQTRNALQLSENLYGKQVQSLEQQLEFFRDLVSEQLRQHGKGTEVLAQQVASSERIQLAQIGHAQGLFKDLLGEAHGNQVLLQAIRSLEYNLMTGISIIDIEDQLATIKQEKPSLLARVAGQLESAGYGALAGPALEWIKQHAQQ